MGGMLEARVTSRKKVELFMLSARSLKSGLVLPTQQIFGLFGPPKKCVNFDKFNQQQVRIWCFEWKRMFPDTRRVM